MKLRKCGIHEPRYAPESAYDWRMLTSATASKNCHLAHLRLGWTPSSFTFLQIVRVLNRCPYDALLSLLSPQVSNSLAPLLCADIGVHAIASFRPGRAVVLCPSLELELLYLLHISRNPLLVPSPPETNPRLEHSFTEVSETWLAASSRPSQVLLHHQPQNVFNVQSTLAITDPRIFDFCP